MKVTNLGKNEKTLPDGTIVPVDGTVDVDNEVVAGWVKHPVILAWLEGSEISMDEELPSADESNEDIGEWSRTKLIRFLKSKELDYKGSTDELRERVQEALTAE